MHKCLIFLAICATSKALPSHKRSIESGSDEYKNLVPDDLVSSTDKPKSKVITVYTAEDLATAAEAGNKLVLIFVMTSWCPISRAISPTVEDIANTKDVVVIKVIKDKIGNEERKKQWKYGVGEVKRVPTFILVRNGEEIFEVNKNDLVSAVSKFAMPRLL